MDTILILDFGGQTTQLIGRRIRDFGVYSEIVPGSSPVDPSLKDKVKGLILSGSPHSAWREGSPRPRPGVLTGGLPVLGICYGFHQLTLLDGGEVQPLPHREYGRARVTLRGDNPLFAGVPGDFLSWMSHGDSVAALGAGFGGLAESEHGAVAAAAHRERPLWGLQFHPEADHCEFGSRILENFACGICGAAKEWTIEHYIEAEIAALRAKVAGPAGSGGLEGEGPAGPGARGDSEGEAGPEGSGAPAGEGPGGRGRDVLLLISGGVDSTVAAALLLKALPPRHVHLMYIDTGMMRAGETEEVSAALRRLGAENILIIDARRRFIDALGGISDPEEKRKIIGDLFIRVQEEEIPRHLSPDYLLAQGTLYTDLIESGAGVGDQAQVIKSHHNVGSPLVQAKRAAGELIEPLERLYKDEVRRLGERLGLPAAVVRRHPFPGPGLAIRILSDITEAKLDILRRADALYIEELRRRGLYDKIWQAFCVLLPVRSVGVTGDARDYGYVLALRAVASRDGMTADVYDFPAEDLLEISAGITNAVKEIGRVVYDISSKPPATIEWE